MNTDLRGWFSRVSDQSKPAISIAGIGAGRRSPCEALAEVIGAKVEVGLSAQRIYQDLVEQNGFSDTLMRRTLPTYLKPFINDESGGF